MEVPSAAEASARPRRRGRALEGGGPEQDSEDSDLSDAEEEVLTEGVQISMGLKKKPTDLASA